MEEAKEMSFMGHLAELRKNLIRMALYIVAAMIFAFLNDEFIYDTVIFGPLRPDFPLYTWMCQLSHLLGQGDSLCMDVTSLVLQNRMVTGQFQSHMWVSFISGLVIAFPLVVWEIWKFVKPGLTNKEVANTRGIVFYITVLFLIGIAFGYYIISPISINFFSNYTVGDGHMVSNFIELSSYISNVVNVSLAAGIMFQLPMAIFVLSKMDLIGPDFLIRNRKYAIVVILIIAAVLTPPDVVSQIMLSIPILMLYESGIWISKRVAAQRAKKEAEEEAEDRRESTEVAKQD